MKIRITYLDERGRQNSKVVDNINECNIICEKIYTNGGKLLKIKTLNKSKGRCY